MAKTKPRKPNTTASGELACAFGEAHLGSHPLCDAESDRACRLFDEAVARGEYDEEGFSPLERAAQQRWLQAEGRLF